MFKRIESAQSSFPQANTGLSENLSKHLYEYLHYPPGNLDANTRFFIKFDSSPKRRRYKQVVALHSIENPENSTRDIKIIEKDLAERLEAIDKIISEKNQIVHFHITFEIRNKHRDSVGFVPTFLDFGKLRDSCVFYIEYRAGSQILDSIANTFTQTVSLLTRSNNDANSLGITSEVLFGKNSHRTFMGYQDGIFVSRARPDEEIIFLEQLDPDCIILHCVSICGNGLLPYDKAIKTFTCCTVRRLIAKYHKLWDSHVRIGPGPTPHEVQAARRELRGNIRQHVAEMLSMMTLLRIMDAQNNDGIMSYIAPAYRPIAFVLDESQN